MNAIARNWITDVNEAIQNLFYIVIENICKAISNNLLFNLLGKESELN